jgi:hypothetical protein
VPQAAPAEETPPEAVSPEVESAALRTLDDVPWSELDRAVGELCARLGIQGSVDGLYDLYAAVAAEWGKAHRARE